MFCFFFSPPSIRPYALKLPVLRNWYPSILVPVFCHLKGVEFLAVSSRRRICGIRGRFWFVAEAELIRKCYLIFACSKEEVCFITYKQTEVTSLKLEV